MSGQIWRPNVTVAAIVERDDHFLMVEEENDGNRVFNQPAGHLEDSESFLSAIIREMREETRRQFEPEALVGCYRWRNPDNELTFLRMVYSGTVGEENHSLTLDGDIVAIHWLPYDVIKQHRTLRSPLVLQCVNDYLNGQQYPLDFIRELPTST